MPNDLPQDPRPQTALQGDGVESFENDPTEGEEFDTSPDALAEITQGAMLESAALPPVKWADDKDHPDFAHLTDPGITPAKTFQFNKAVFDLLCAANHFKPRGKNGQVAFGLRGGTLQGDDTQENATSVQITDNRPNHSAFRCTLGIIDTNTGKINAYTGSTVPNQPWMQNYFKLQNNIPTPKKTRANMLPTGCYIYRVNAHGGGKINPALRMTDPDNLSADGACTVLRTHDDLTYKHDDLWDRCTPFDNIHCAYSDTSFSSAGCQTIKGADGKGAWGKFQDRIGALGWNARIDYVLLTGREAAIAAAIIAAGKQDDTALIRRALGRLRVGSEGDAVVTAQKKMGFQGSGYFGPLTKKRLTEIEAENGLPTDGLYDPKDDAQTGWGVFKTSAVSPSSPQPETLQSALWTVGVDTPKTGIWHNDDATGGMRFSPHAGQNIRINTDLLLVSGDHHYPVQVMATVHAPDPQTPEIELILTAKTGPQPAAPAIQTASLETGISAADFDAFAPKARDDYRDAILSHGKGILGEHDITGTKRRLTHFLAQMAHESGDFRHRIESMNYTSAAQIQKTWPSRFKTLAAAKAFVRNEEKLANKVYAGRMGNAKPGDGFRFRGRGLIQLTGREAYRTFGKLLGVDLEGKPDLAFDPIIALRIAAAFWGRKALVGERLLNFLADDDKIRAITYRINGGTTNLPHRAERLADAKRIFGDDGPVATIARVVDRGDKSDLVRTLQNLLIRKGFLSGLADGKFGFNSYKALRRFKERMGLANVGHADEATFAALAQESLLESGLTLADDDLPVIGDEPEPIRVGIAQFEKDS